jgi:hypothetical protein
LLALWVARAYQEEHRKNSREPLITLGSAPLADPTFRDALFEQLGSDQLSIPVTTDIIGKKDAHAVRLDREAIDAIKKARLHQRVATAIFFESNGGQSQTRMEASVPEIRAAIGNPDTNLADVETVLEGLTANCFYLNWDRNRYRFGLRPNLNQMLVTRRGSVKDQEIEGRIQQTTLDLFKAGSKFLDRRCFPTKTNDVPDRPQLVLVVLGLEHLAQQPATRSFIESILRECGTAGRTYKSGLLFIAPDQGSSITEAARNVLAWEDIAADEDTARQLEEAQRRSLSQSLGRAKADLKESIWRAYRHVFLLGKDNTVKSLDLGQITSSMAPSLCDLVINTLVKDDEITDVVGANKLIRLWPPALTEWSTKAVRDAFFASPALPRLLDPNSIKRTIADGVTSKLFGYASRDAAGQLQLDCYGECLSEQEVEISDDLYILRAQDAERLLEPPCLERLVIQPSSIDVAAGEHVTFKVTGLDQYGQGFPVEKASWSAPDCTVSSDGSFKASDTPGLYLVTVEVGGLQVEAKVRVRQPVTATKTSPDDGKNVNEEHPEKKIQWSGTIPPRKWMNFYTKVISKLANSPGLTVRVSLEAPAEGESNSAKIEDIKSALRELGLDEDVKG